jgi:hypothetical protein
MGKTDFVPELDKTRTVLGKLETRTRQCGTNADLASEMQKTAGTYTDNAAFDTIKTTPETIIPQ